MSDTHKQALKKAIENANKGRSLRAPVEIASLYDWLQLGRIPLIHVGEVARAADMLPSSVDPSWKGKDNTYIVWGNDDE